MTVTIESFWLPKAGNTPEEYEDAFWLPPGIMLGNKKICRFAIADGATETSFSNIWASQLVEAYGKNITEHSQELKWLSKLQKQWLNQVNSKELPWHAQNKLKQGAFSTLLGLTLRLHEKKYESVAIGDSCLFHLRNNQLLCAFPLENPTEFNQHPFLLSSVPHQDDNPLDRLKIMTGQWQEQDYFLLMTDALAQWFLFDYAQSQQTWQFLLHVNCQEEFTNIIKNLRNSKTIKDDDVTLLRITII